MRNERDKKRGTTHRAMISLDLVLENVSEVRLHKKSIFVNALSGTTLQSKHSSFDYLLTYQRTNSNLWLFISVAYFLYIYSIHSHKSCNFLDLVALYILVHLPFIAHLSISCKFQFIRKNLFPQNPFDMNFYWQLISQNCFCFLKSGI